MVIMSNVPHDVIVRRGFRSPYVGRGPGPGAGAPLQLCLHVFLDVVCLDGRFKLAVCRLKGHAASPQIREILALS